MLKAITCRKSAEPVIRSQIATHVVPMLRGFGPFLDALIEVFKVEKAKAPLVTWMNSRLATPCLCAASSSAFWKLGSTGGMAATCSQWIVCRGVFRDEEGTASWDYQRR